MKLACKIHNDFIYHTCLVNWMMGGGGGGGGIDCDFVRECDTRWEAKVMILGYMPLVNPVIFHCTA